MQTRKARLLAVSTAAVVIILLVAGGTYASGPMMRTNSNCEGEDCPDCDPVGLTEDQREQLNDLRQSFREKFFEARKDILTDEQLELMGQKERMHEHEGKRRTRQRCDR